MLLGQISDNDLRVISKNSNGANASGLQESFLRNIIVKVLNSILYKLVMHALADRNGNEQSQQDRSDHNKFIKDEYHQN